jgi:hypothetical protein
MKRTSLISVYILLSMFCFSSISYSNTDIDLLTKYSTELLQNGNKTRYNTEDYQNSMKDDSQFHYILFMFQHVGDLLLWSHDTIIATITDFTIDSPLKNKLLPFRQQRLNRIQNSIIRNLKYFTGIYGYIKGTALLHIIDKERDVMRSSLYTLDKTIELMKKMNQ